MLQLALALSVALAGACPAAPMAGVRYFTLPLTGVGMTGPGGAAPGPSCTAGQLDFSCDAGTLPLVVSL